MDGAKKGDVQWWAKRKQSRGSWQEDENWGRQDSHYTRAAKTLVSLNGFRKVLFIKEIYFRAPHFELSLKHYSLSTTIRNRTDHI